MPLSSVSALVGSTAAALAGGMYLNAKLNLGSDIYAMLTSRAAFKQLAKAVSQKRLSPFYLFEETALARGDAEAIWSSPALHNECLTYTETYTRVLQYANWFLAPAQGVKPGDHVVLYMGNSADLMCAWLGLLAIGAAPALVNTNLAGKALLHCVEIAKASLLVMEGGEDMVDRIEGVRAELEASGHKVVRLRDVKGELLALEPKRPGDELRKKAQPHSSLGLVFTSGTTGLPKAIIFPMYAGFLVAAVRKSGYGPLKPSGGRCYNCMPIYHMTGGIAAFGALLTGDTLCIAPKFSARAFWPDVRASRATYFIYVGETLRYLLAQPPPTPASLDKDHAVHTIWGNGLRADIWVAFRERFGIDTILEFYNSSELMFGLSVASRGDFTAKSLGLHGALLRWSTRGAYIAVEVDTESGALVRDEKTGLARQVPFDIGGEILIRLEPGSKVPGKDFRGYWQSEEATSKKLARNVLKKGDCYYRTGDSMRRDRDGRWFFGDRLGDTFRWKGENVSTTEVADALGGFPGILEANVYGVQLPGHDGRAGAVALLIEADKRGSFDFAGFLRHCRFRLPTYAVPVFIRLTHGFYSTGNHKQNKVPLRGEGVDPAKVTNNDAIYWIEGNGKGETYVPFTKADWDSLQTARARL
ncbi:fatty acid transporter [Coniella lustricola]|uniref:Fatty acid transporter n=1 Tax=Coniella lustricola TaxID=2025994 RepID=A0A2T2ZVG5_9PEZI|nr:fatty acid transporter [Coniella lustricola]